MRRIVLEITQTSIRVLAADGPLSSPRIVKFLVEPLAGELDKEILHRVLAGLQPARARLISVMPREQTITRLLRLPAIRLDELEQMIELSGKAQLPYPPAQAVADFHVVEQHAGTSQVQLVACQRELIDRQLAVFRQEGVEPGIIVPTSWGLLAWYQRLGRAAEIREPVLVVNVDADRTDLALIRQGRLAFSRSVSQGLRDWQAAPNAPESLAEELHRSLAGLRKEWPSMEAGSLLMTGLGPLEEWKALLEQRLGKPAVVRNVQGHLRFPKGPEEIGASPAVVLGLAMAEPQWLVNLLPREARHAQSQRRRMQELIVTGVLLLVCLLVGAGLLLASVRRQERFVEHNLRALKTLEAITRQTERQERDVKLIKATLGSRRWTAAMLTQLVQVTPPDVFFETLVFERARGELVIRGNAPETRQVLDYVRQLKQSGQWDRVELRYSARRSLSTQARTDFEIVLYRGGS